MAPRFFILIPAFDMENNVMRKLFLDIGGKIMTETIKTGHTDVQKNPLGTAPIGKLLLQFALPTVISLLVNSIYNMVDQIFIGWGVGALGNSATNVIFPLILISTAIALLFGDGGATLMNLHLGQDERKKAEKAVGEAIVLLIIAAVIVLVLMEIFLSPILHVLGATPDNYPYAVEYGRIIVIGFPFMIFTTGLSSMIRADGSPKLTMAILLLGAAINVVLDAIFVLGMDMGMTGAALATIIGQIISALICVMYLKRFKTVTVTRSNFRLTGSVTKRIMAVGISSTISMASIAIISTIGNNILRYLGPMTEFGADIPLAAFGITMKVTSIFVAVMNGIAAGCNPIFAYNYSIRNYARVKKLFFLAVLYATLVAVICFIAAEVFPETLTKMFGENGELYNRFSVNSFRIFNAVCFVNGFHIVTCMFFQAIGKPVQSVINTLGRQVVLNIILSLLFSFTFAGIWGCMIGAAVTDAISFIVALIFVIVEMKHMDQAMKQRRGSNE